MRRMRICPDYQQHSFHTQREPVEAREKREREREIKQVRIMFFVHLIQSTLLY